MLSERIQFMRLYTAGFHQTTVNDKPLLIRNPILEQSDALQPSNEAVGYNMPIISKERVEGLTIYPSIQKDYYDTW